MMNLVPIIILPLIPNNSCGSAPKETEIKNGWIQLEYKMSQIANVRMKIWVDLHRLFLINITKITHRFASTEIVTEIVLGISHSSKKKIIIHQRKCFFFVIFEVIDFFYMNVQLLLLVGNHNIIFCNIVSQFYDPSNS